MASLLQYCVKLCFDFEISAFLSTKIEFFWKLINSEGFFRWIRKDLLVDYWQKRKGVKFNAEKILKNYPQYVEQKSNKHKKMGKTLTALK